MKNKYGRLIVLLLVLSLVLVTVGTTLAFFTYNATGETLNTITVGGITFHYEELDGKGRGISITDAMPVASNENAKIGDKYFNFKITSTTTGGTNIPYVVTARMDPSSDEILGDIIDIYLTDESNNPTPLFEGELKKYNELEQYDQVTGYTEKIIYTDTVTSSDYEKNFRLRMWIDANTNLNTGNGQSDYNNKQFSITVNVNAVGSLADNNGGGETNDPNLLDPSDPDSPFYDPPITLAPGLYTDTGVEENDELILSWQELLDNGYISVTDTGVAGVGENYDTFKNMTGKLILDSSVKSIKRSGFGSCSISTYIIPDSVTSIGNFAFSYNSKLKKVHISNSVSYIGNYAFRNCSLLEDVKLSASLTSINTSTFTECTKLASINIPEGVTEIGSQAFYKNTSLTSVRLPSTLIRMDSSFSECTALESITFPENLEETVYGTFSGCTSLKNVVFNDKIKKIGDSTFYGCTSLETVNIPSSVVYLGPSVFSQSGVKNVTIPNSISTLRSMAFYNCTNLESIEIPSSITTMEDSVFSHSGLKSITIPSSITTLPNSIFAWCSDLEEVNLPEGLETIEQLAFARTTSLAEITIPSTVTKVGKNVFEMGALTSATFLDNVGWTVNGNIADFGTPETAAQTLNATINQGKEFIKQ